MTTPTTTITTHPVAPLVQRLFAEARVADAPIRARIAAMPAAEREALIRGGDYGALYGIARDAFLPISPETGRLLYLLARAARARNIVEFGTSFGISTIHLAAAIADNGGGRLVGSELEPTKAARARAHLREAGLDHLVEIRDGDALVTLARDLPAPIDLVLLDGAKSLYPQILAFVEPQLRAGALIVADNADDAPAYLARVRDPAAGYLSVPFADDVELSIRL